MLLASDGTTIGMVSGGCLENDLRERALPVMASQGMELITYDSTSSDDIVWGLGLGCAGMVHVLMEGTSRPEVRKSLELAKDASRTGEPFVLATVFSTSGSPGLTPGSRWLQTGNACNSVGTWNDAFSRVLRDACSEALSSGRAGVNAFSGPAGRAEVFIEVVQPALPLMIFGAGADALPMTRFGLELGWQVSVIDTRAAHLNMLHDEAVQRILLQQPSDLLDAVAFRGREAAVVMTHNFNLDYEFLRILLASPVRYVGLLGSRQKSAMLMAKLEDEGLGPPAAQRVKLFSPVGLDIGAETPAEIALSVVAEIQSVIASGSGSSLRTLQGSIHTLHA